MLHNEFLRKFLTKERERKGVRRKGDDGNKSLKDRDHFWAVTSSLHYSLLIPTLFGLLWVSFSCDYSLLYSPSVLYLISTVQVFHGTLGNLIWLSRIQIHVFFFPLYSLLLSNSQQALFCGTVPWLLGLEISKNQFLPPWYMVWGYVHKFPVV